MIEILKQNNDEDVNCYCVALLSYFLVEKKQERQIEIGLKEILKSGSISTRLFVLALLEIMEDTRYISVLTVQLNEDSNPSVRFAAAMALSCIGGSEIIDILTKALEHQDSNVRLFAASYLKDQGLVLNADDLLKGVLEDQGLIELNQLVSKWDYILL